MGVKIPIPPGGVLAVKDHGFVVGAVRRNGQAVSHIFIVNKGAFGQFVKVDGFGDGFGRPRGRVGTGAITVNYIIAIAGVDRVAATAAIHFVIAVQAFDLVVACACDDDIVMAVFTRQDGIVVINLVAVGVRIATLNRVIAGRAGYETIACIIGPSHNLSPFITFRTHLDPSGVAAGARAATPSIQIHRHVPKFVCRPLTPGNLIVSHGKSAASAGHIVTDSPTTAGYTSFRMHDISVAAPWPAVFTPPSRARKFLPLGLVQTKGKS